jgi:hypothetical protein
MAEVRNVTLRISRIHSADSSLNLQAFNLMTAQRPLWRVKHLEVVER